MKDLRHYAGAPNPSSSGRRGLLLATILSGSWRPSAPPLDIAPEALETAIPGLLAGGLAGLTWQRLRRSLLAGAAFVGELRDAYRRQALTQRQQEINIARLVTELRAAGVDPLVLKGWAVTRLYPEPALRPFGDLDLVVRPEQVPRARQIIARGGYGGITVDLEHADIARLAHSIDELSGRSRLVSLDGTEVRILNPEDQLAHLCLHFLRHSGERPLWLVDIAVALESRPSDFDWDLCLGPEPRRADSIACAIGVAHQLLGADVDGTPVAERARHLPRWLPPAVLRHWEDPPFREFVTSALVRSTLRRPWTLPRELVERWPDPIRATAQVNGPFNELPRFPFQAAAYLLWTGRMVQRLPSLLRE